MHACCVLFVMCVLEKSVGTLISKDVSYQVNQFLTGILCYFQV
jgi:hypothetical protein